LPFLVCDTLIDNRMEVRERFFSVDTHFRSSQKVEIWSVDDQYIFIHMDFRQIEFILCQDLAL